MAGELVSRHRGIFWIGPQERPPVDGASLILVRAKHSEARRPGRDGDGAEAVRAAAGQDPDVIAVAEIWDAATLLAAAEAALAGSLVLGRVHERTAPGALELLRKAGMAPWRLATALLAVVAQTSVRRLCPACRREGRPADAVFDSLGLRRDGAAREDLARGSLAREVSARAGLAFPTFVPIGCKQCFSTGYAGRTGVFSILEVRDELACLLRDGAGAAAVSDAARKAGMKTLREGGLELARRGETSLEELERVL
jgi:type II secretory ATPase GspE/PulE/Tfp pilus assembly ATPase PilB-like protein